MCDRYYTARPFENQNVHLILNKRNFIKYQRLKRDVFKGSRLQCLFLPDTRGQKA